MNRSGKVIVRGITPPSSIPVFAMWCKTCCVTKGVLNAPTPGDDPE